MNLVELLDRRASEHPDRLALVDEHHGTGRTVSYGELSRRVRAGAAMLRDAGLNQGQTVLVFQPVSIELYEFLLASFHFGLRIMLADPSAGREFLSLCCQRVRPDAFFGSWKAQLLRITTPGMRKIPLAISSGAWFPGAEPWQVTGPGIPMISLPDEEPALITFTSGSTGVPKAAVRTHGFLLAQHRALSEALDHREGEVDLITLPVFVLANLASGLTSVLAATDLRKPGTPAVGAIARQCREYQVTRCAASPAFFEGLLQDEKTFPAFRKLYTGGAPVFPDLLRRLRRALPFATIHSVYGSTEAEPIAHFPAEDADETTDSITRRGGGLCSGAPVDAIRLRIIHDQWGKPLGPLEENEFSTRFVTIGQAGEIIVSGDHVLQRYLDGTGDEETKIHVENAVWHRTGDAGWMDDSGRVWLLGRCSEKMPVVIAPEGIPLDALAYPFAIECALREIFPGIRMAALAWNGKRTLVVGKVCDTAESTLIQDEAIIFGIDRVVYLASLPLDRRHNAKIDYPALREILRKQP